MFALSILACLSIMSILSFIFILSFLYSLLMLLAGQLEQLHDSPIPSAMAAVLTRPKNKAEMVSILFVMLFLEFGSSAQAKKNPNYTEKHSI